VDFLEIAPKYARNKYINPVNNYRIAHTLANSKVGASTSMMGTLKKTSYKAFFKVSGENVM
jgi:hypothetical protein